MFIKNTFFRRQDKRSGEAATKFVFNNISLTDAATAVVTITATRTHFAPAAATAATAISLAVAVA
jgi:hypothetical protein